MSSDGFVVGPSIAVEIEGYLFLHAIPQNIFPTRSTEVLISFKLWLEARFLSIRFVPLATYIHSLPSGFSIVLYYLFPLN